RRAVLVVAGRAEHAHADRGQPIGRDKRPDVLVAETKPARYAPHVAPLRLFDPLAPGDEILERAEGDHVLGEEQPRAGVVHRPDMFRQVVEPRPDASDIIRIGLSGHTHSLLRVPATAGTHFSVAPGWNGGHRPGPERRS